MLFRWFTRPPLQIDEQLWRSVLDRYALASHLNTNETGQLRSLCSEFLSQKTISGAHGFEINDRVRVTIAFQACLPVLKLGLAHYDDFVEIIVYPAQFRVPRQIVDEDGLVHESIEDLSGEAMDGGPVVLSWPDVQADDMNVTIHEFIHKLDLADGEADGIPSLSGPRRRRWREILHQTYEHFCDALDAIEAAIPPDVDPESEQADRWFDHLPMDPYAATDPAEFFAVSGEAFFVTPHQLAQAYPAWYRELAEFFGQDPRNC
jgi:Mlc titration factor MtfA (ptsG expression regulator)